LGGPFHYIDRIGATMVVSTLTSLMHKYGERFAPCEALQRMAQQDEKFYKAQTNGDSHIDSVV